METENENELRYEVWLVPNGRRTDFICHGMTGAGWPDACTLWGEFATLDEVRDAYAAWADENFNRECGPCEEYDDDDARDKACAEEIARARETLSIEWHDDLKWVLTRKMRGDEFVEVV